MAPTNCTIVFINTYLNKSVSNKAVGTIFCKCSK